MVNDVISFSVFYGFCNGTDLYKQYYLHCVQIKIFQNFYNKVSSNHTLSFIIGLIPTQNTRNLQQRMCASCKKKLIKVPRHQKIMFKNYYDEQAIQLKAFFIDLRNCATKQFSSV